MRLAWIVLVAGGLTARDCETAAASEDQPLFATQSVGATVDGPPAFGSAQVDVEAPLPVLNVDIDAPPAPTATVDVDARHGGSVVHAGPHPIEVVPHASGEVHAYVQGPRPPEARLTVDVPVRGRPRGRPVRLEWDADAGHYRGAVPRGVHIVPGPVAVHYHVGPRVYDVHAPHVVVGPTIVIDGPRWHWGRGKFRGHGKFRGRGHGKFRGPRGHGMFHGPRGHGRIRGGRGHRPGRHRGPRGRH